MTFLRFHHYPWTDKIILLHRNLSDMFRRRKYEGFVRKLQLADKNQIRLIRKPYDVVTEKSTEN